MTLNGKHIFLGVTGGIAAYKCVELLRLFKKAGADVVVGMTRAATRFVGPATFEVLSENPVLVDLWEGPGSGVSHIEVASTSDLAVIAPATANCIGKLAHGIADDALTTTMLAMTCPVLICPSMNTDMYQNMRVQKNLDLLEETGIHILDPDSGALACKTTGAGRLPEPWFIFDRACTFFYKNDLKGKTVLVSAGPTVEPLDPVRFISNHSSGKMGYAIAGAAEKRGAKVILVSGPVSLDPPVGVACVPVGSCDQMYDAMFDHLDQADIIIKVAAVGDFKPVSVNAHKIKKTGDQDQDHMTLELIQNKDILKAIGLKKRKDQYLVGFAAETRDLETYAVGKMEKKHLDMIAANIVGKSGSGFKADTNKVKLFTRDGHVTDLPLMTKEKVAHAILDAVVQAIS
ncbi:bifunctional phosphopantothenoylcysteine decarboxylase/phosphopantothenate--cysteine ligase CoaBC [Desulfobacter hydrogenophilus]|uniref:Coenzyme A biosynthesis bifunctional protein CoaBC n=1 Tax=Desulfobacter hydrogenophilus TaxID=2291 RepID=A0A328FH53_9BACT|nr:bifunctional phosphopantothenoylcysteine decarboxylase/phosphopantothenate--cysteine ligase CoaBC [Desulfobacter hydrogenophilus]NDY71800.1 bifunctional phosphopantothenoylcysteine decarboxylase/phosphopantothenate--cysteine ligase CoaBC [Desulfobacter hydrogenophilus]QBH13498.1 bifunctional phosphopantothenoylcysteine decarboxylase/phosphopantothenate--cysteine ligase CoaBC [Desulfobacter hydrogenophilus]RAM03749.1 bifunctional phosphopantothenoylcysteine decarboxylase/phosphopantothenate--c